jgi:hypothetical protein
MGIVLQTSLSTQCAGMTRAFLCCRSLSSYQTRMARVTASAPVTMIAPSA